MTYKVKSVDPSGSISNTTPSLSIVDTERRTTGTIIYVEFAYRSVVVFFDLYKP